MRYSTEEEVKAADKLFALELRRQRNEPEGVINPEFLRAVDEGFIVRAQRPRTDDHDMTLIDQDLVESSWRYRAYEISESLRARRLDRFGVRVTPADQLLPRPPAPAVAWKNVVKIAQASLKGDGWVLHMSDDTRDLMAAIDRLCATPACVADAVTTCYVETRCRMGICGRHGCGPYQQLPRYASVDGTTRETLPVDPVVATRQFLVKRERYRRSHGSAWPRRYNGSDRAEAYLQKWTKINRRLRNEQQKAAEGK